MDLHKFIGETMRITESDWISEPKKGKVPEITPDLINTLVNDVPEIKDVDQDELQKGLKDEASEHFDSVGGDMVTIAKITLDHLRKFPGQKYYSAVEQLESELSKAGEQEVTPAPTEEPVEEPAAEPDVKTEEPVKDPVAYESKTTEAKTEEKKTVEAKVSEETAKMGTAAVEMEQKKSDKEATDIRKENKKLDKTV